MIKPLLTCLLLWLACALSSLAQESPFFVTYTHHMEEPGNLDVENSTTAGVPRSGQRLYSAPYLELEYGVTARWTYELYLEGHWTPGDSTAFPGWVWGTR